MSNSIFVKNIGKNSSLRSYNYAIISHRLLVNVSMAKMIWHVCQAFPWGYILTFDILSLY